MFVRWIVRRHKNAEVADVIFHDAYLVESYRDDEGAPRQRTISYLGNIRQISGVLPGIERELFLLRAELILNSLPELSPGDCTDVLAQLHQRVPPLTPSEIETGFYNTLRWYFRWWQTNGGGPAPDELDRMIRQAQNTANVRWSME
ncbi:MAG: hypothetical protein HC828_16375 [Blastochloris sp.]|nr:hypothetical protein [Blastochloris sp.]